ncbi:hypothetical protein [Sphingomonas baiyangensis]|uniref:Uncharacterized protein n=1 Tax=Sphingomonas baiyangensis TaxID=2572576 RepID=A0A4U1L2D9_9SPHN|nr:hypothetical protein [Sphingomonas baiyangensis]TKD50186.1 hypothetical protein FBR43_05030 [Sphingomonas baiyangensis]
MLARRTPLKRGKPMRSKRKGYKPAKIVFHHNRVAELGCAVSGQPATLHHVSASIHGGRITRSDRCVVPLAPEYHMYQHGSRTSVEALGHAGFHATYGIDLEELGNRLWAETEAIWEAMHGKGQVNG